MEIFGSTIKETLRALKPRHLGAEKNSTQKDKIIAISRIIISVIFLFIATFLFVNGREDACAGICGTIVGYWLK